MKRIFKKLTKKVVLAILALIVIGAPLLYLTVLNQKEAKASWYDDNWAYRQAIPVTSTNGSAQANVFVSFTLDTATAITAGKLQSSCQDIRITDVNGALLKYHVGRTNACNNAATTVDFLTSSFPDGTSTYYVYYGNPSAPSLDAGAFTQSQASNYTIGTLATAETAPGPVAYWKFDEGGGTNTSDSTASKANGALVNMGNTATGGTITYSDGYTNHTFTSSGTFTPNQAGNIEALVVGGGGGGAWGAPGTFEGGGGGAGGYKYVASQTVAAQAYTVTVDGGGGGGSAQGNAGTDGGSSSIGSLITAAGGGGGGEWGGSAASAVGHNGASGGGGGTAGTGGSGTAGQGNNGGNGAQGSHDAGGGGGGAGAVGSNGTAGSSSTGGNGGDGTANSISGSSVTYAGGGGGGGDSGGAGGAGGGGAKGSAGTANTGGGGGGGNGGGGQAGGSGIVIIRYFNGWQSEDQCISGKCLRLDGSTTKVTASSAVTGVKTVSMWVKPITLTSTLIDLDGGTHKITVNSSGTITATGFSSPTIYVNGVVSSTLVANTWQYVTVTTGTSFNTTSSLAIGSDGTTYLKGFVDEVKLYNYARTAAQVTTDFASKGSVKGVSTEIGSDPQNNIAALNNGLVGYWKMDESSGNTADSSGNSSTLTNNNTTTYAAGKFGNAGSFAKASTQYFSGADSSTLRVGTGNFTISSWVYLSSATIEMAIASKYDTASKREWGIEYNYVAQRFQFTMSPDGSATTTVKADNLGVPVTGQWYFVVGWYDGVNMNISVNNGTPNTAAYTTGTTGSTAPFEIGGLLVNGSTTLTWDGKIDEVRLYKRALSSADISTLYNFAPGPVGYWKMDENSGTTLNDSSGNGNGGVLSVGATGTQTTAAQAWKSGKYGAGLNFDGTDDDATVANTISTNTVEFWVNPSSTTANMVALTGSAYITSSSGTISATGFTSPTIYVNGVVNGTITANTWNHIAVTTGTAISASAITFGLANSTYLNGKLDDIRFYNYARTQQQITQDMNAGHPPPGSPVGSAVGQWKFDEGYGTTANNSGNGGLTLNGTLTGMASPATTTSGWTNSGKFGKGLLFDGTDDYISLGNPSSLNITGNITVSAWVKFSTSQLNKPIVARWGSDQSYLLTVDFTTNNKLKFCIRVSEVNKCAASTNTYNDGNWHYVAGIFDGANVLLYVDGGNEKVTGDATSGPIDSPSQNVYIGAYNDATNPFTGTIDEVKIYNSALTASQVLLDMNRSQAQVLGALSDNSSYQVSAANQEYCVPGDLTACAAPIGEWKFEENQGTSAQDSSGNGYTGTWNGTGTPHWKQGKYGSAGNFNGTDDYVTLASGVRVFQSLTAGTTSFWMKMNTCSGQQIIYEDGSGFNNFSAATPANCSSTFTFNIGSNTSRSSTKTSWNTGQWYHLTIVWDTTIRIYVDGQLDNTIATDVDTAVGANQTQFGRYCFGASCGTTGGYFNGQIDQIRVYNYARTPAQIVWDYNRGGPIGHWKFDECQGTVANDASGNGNSGAITIGTGAGTGHQDSVGTCTTNAATAWYGGRTGKYNSSLNFDGIDDYVTAPNNSSLNFAGDFTISTWVKTTQAASLNNWPMIVFKESSGVGRTGYELGLHNSNVDSRWYGTIYVSNTGYGVYGTSNIADGNWHHLIFQRSGSNIQTYEDGKSSNTAAAVSTDLTNTYQFNIGIQIPNSYPFNGQIDDVRIYNYALTATQIKGLYNGGGAVRFGPSTGAP